MMPKPAVDNKRSGVKAWRLTDWPDDGYSEPGGIMPSSDGHGAYGGSLLLACPGCGQVSSMRVADPKPAQSPSWAITAGSINEPETLTLTPSINCVGCCGWHGWLTGGVFNSC